MKEYTVEKQEYSNTTWINVIGENDKKERLVISICECTNPGGQNSLPALWYKHGRTNKILETYLSVDAYVYDSENQCWGCYNPQIKRSEDGRRSVIDFDWMLENTEENKQKLISECIRRFETAKGKSATEIKLDKIYEYAAKYNLDVLKRIPEGWKEIHCASDPIGCVRVVTNCPMFNRANDGRYVKNPNYKKALLLL